MTHKKNEAGNLLPMTVCEGITVNVLPNVRHEYLMTTKEVANGYGVSDYNIRVHKLQHSDELIEGKHFVMAVSITNGELPSALKTAHNAILWTKRGIVRLGFFIKSERAKMFRDWAEELIIKIDEQKDLFGNTVPVKRALPPKRNHNRLTSERLIRLLTLANHIQESDLRNAIVSELTGNGGDYGTV